MTFDYIGLKKYLDKFIIGQDKAKEMLIAAIYNHMIIRDMDNNKYNSTHLLLIGPTGSGKTFLMHKIFEFLKIPFMVVDATKLTQTGYIGESVEDIFFRMLQKANNNVLLAEKSIIYIDEFDKIAQRKDKFNEKDITGEGVQYELLKVLEGGKYQIQLNNNLIEIDTSKILFVCGGSFNLSRCKIIEEKRSFLYNYGFIDELIGRFQVIIELDTLSEENLFQILRESESSIIKKYQYILSNSGCDLVVEESALRNIAYKTKQLNLGARGLESILEEVLLKTTYRVLLDRVGKYVVTEEEIDKMCIS